MQTTKLPTILFLTILAMATESPVVPQACPPPPDRSLLDCPALTTPARLDLLVVYPRAVFTDLSLPEQSDFENFVMRSVSLANDAFACSRIDAFYNLVGFAPLLDPTDQPPPTGVYDALHWLDGAGITPTPAEVAALREAFGADIVALFIPFPWDDNPVCGTANLPREGYASYLSANLLVAAPFGHRAFSAHRIGCGLNDFTLAHEIGHNFGMRHHYELANPDEGHLFRTGLGKNLYDVGKATVMGCLCSGSECDFGPSTCCHRIPYFSDPEIVYVDPDTGQQEATGIAAERENAMVGRLQVGTFSAFRPESTNFPPFADFTLSCLGHSCSFDAGLSSDDTPLPTDSYWWDFGDRTNGTDRTASHTYASYGSYAVNLVVTDSGGQRVVARKTATPGPRYAGVHEVANCRSIAGWAWDEGEPNQPVNVHILRDLGILATVPANIFRQDLLDAGKGNGAHGFNYVPTSSWKDGRWHVAKVRFGGTTIDLASTPRNLICGVTCFTTQTPGGLFVSGASGLTVATQFSSTHSGFITHLRFYRGQGETGTNVGRLWSDSGTLLAQATFPASPTSGWVEVAIPPVAITAGARYRAGVNTNSRYVKSGCGLGSGITNEVLTAHQGFQSAGNGTFPTTGSCANYFVDVKFDL